MNPILLLQSQSLGGSTASSLGVLLPSPERVPGRFRPLASARLEQALSALGNEFVFGNRTRFRVFVSGRPKPLDSCVLEHIYLITREALLNAVRHSKATNIEAEVEYLRNKTRVLIRDNGCGIHPQVLIRNAHRGLLAMRERAARAGAELHVWSGLGAGTEIEISMPTHLAQALPA